MADKQRKRLVKTASVYQCSKDLVYFMYILKSEFEQLQRNRRIASIKQNDSNFPGGCLFSIKFLTGQEYELKVVYDYDPKQPTLTFKNIDSTRDKIVIHGEINPTLVKKFIKQDVMDFFYRRKRGFHLEMLVHQYLQRVVEHKESELIVSVRKAETIEENKFRRIDFFLECVFENKKFMITFDLKNNRSAIADAIKNNMHQATIFTDELEMTKNPEKFLGRVYELIIKKIRREGFGITTGTESRHLHIA